MRAGADGITVHPRPDERHIRSTDVYELAEVVAAEATTVEYNIEGNPFPGNTGPDFMAMVQTVRPTQCTLVPDAPEQSTSDHGWDLVRDAARLKPIVAALKDNGIRVSLFMDPDAEQMEAAREVGVDRVELYTERFARCFGGEDEAAVFDIYARAAAAAQASGLGVNAGHDLNLYNLPRFCTIPGVLECSIGHALIADALWMSLAVAVRSYRQILREGGRERRPAAGSEG